MLPFLTCVTHLLSSLAYKRRCSLTYMWRLTLYLWIHMNIWKNNIKKTFKKVVIFWHWIKQKKNFSSDPWFKHPNLQFLNFSELFQFKCLVTLNTEFYIFGNNTQLSTRRGYNSKTSLYTQSGARILYINY